MSISARGVDIAKNSGLTVSATNSNLRGDVSIEVYENGTLKSQVAHFSKHKKLKC